MKLRKAIEIINYYAYTVLNLNKKIDELYNLTEEEIEELTEAREKVKSFLSEFH